MSLRGSLSRWLRTDTESRLQFHRATLAVPVVLWLSVGTSPADIVPHVGAAPLVPVPVIVRNSFVEVVFGESSVVVLAADWYGSDPSSVVALPPDRFVAVVAVDALPVVFWLKVGKEVKLAAEPVVVSKVPLVGKVSDVAPLTVNVVPKFPEMVSVDALLLATPVPPEDGTSVAESPAAVPLVFWLKVGKPVRLAADPVVVRSVPDVGNVKEVEALSVAVSGKDPEIVNVDAELFDTPVPPSCGVTGEVSATEFPVIVMPVPCVSCDPPDVWAKVIAPVDPEAPTVVKDWLFIVNCWFAFVDP